MSWTTPAQFVDAALVHRTALDRYLMRCTGDRDEADELLQLVLVQAYQGRGQLRDADKLKSWLFGIARRVVLRAQRSQRRRVGLLQRLFGGAVAPAQRSDEAASPLAHLERHEQQCQVRTALDQLPPRQREVVTLRIDGELDFAAIGEVLGITPGNARVSFHLGLKRLRALLDAEAQP